MGGLPFFEPPFCLQGKLWKTPRFTLQNSPGPAKGRRGGGCGNARKASALLACVFVLEYRAILGVFSFRYRGGGFQSRAESKQQRRHFGVSKKNNRPAPWPHAPHHPKKKKKAHQSGRRKKAHPKETPGGRISLSKLRWRSSMLRPGNRSTHRNGEHVTRRVRRHTKGSKASAFT